MRHHLLAVAMLAALAGPAVAQSVAELSDEALLARVAAATEAQDADALLDAMGEVRAVYVHPDHARHGVGSALLAELEGYARGRGLDRLSLQSSLNAVGFYERAGYERVGEGESPGGLAVVGMEKVL